MAKPTPIRYSRVSGVCIGLDSVDEAYAREVRENQTGHDPLQDPQPAASAATRTTSRPWGETDNRKPYLPTEDVSEPALSEGVSFRQSF